MNEAKSTDGDTAEAPDNSRRIKDVAKSRSTFAKQFKDQDGRLVQMKQTRNQLEGGLPFDPAQLIRDGLGWMTNINWGDAQAAFNRTYLPYWKMVHDVPNTIAATCHSKSPHAGKWAKAIDECFDLFLKDWGCDYYAQFMGFTQDFVKFGPGYAMWPDSDTPRAKHIRTENVVLPKRATANPDDWEIFSFKRDMTISQLWEKIRTPEDVELSEHVGWNPKFVKQAIRLCKGGGNTIANDDWTAIQDAIVSNDIGLCDEWAPIEVVFQYVKGFDGKIACYIFSENSSVEGYLYETSDAAESVREIVAAIFFDIGSGGLVHTIKGFAIKNYHMSVMQNRAKSKLMDAASIAMAFNFQRTDDTPDGAPPVEHYGAVNVFPRGISQMNVYPKIPDAQAVINELAGNMAENNGVYRDPSKQISETDTARQATILANLSEEVGAATTSIYLAQLGERFFAECLRRLMKPGSEDPDAVKFMKRLKERGVPKNINKVEITTSTGANAGTAGAAMRDMIFKELLSLSRMPGVNQRWILEQYFANKLGAQNVDKALLPEGEASAPHQRRMAMIENTVFGQGIPLPVAPADAHFEHCEEHLKPLEAVVSKAKEADEQPSPEHLVLLQVGIPHMDQHFELLKQDETMKDAYGQIWPRYSNTRSIALGIFSKLEAEQRKANQQP